MVSGNSRERHAMGKILTGSPMAPDPDKPIYFYIWIYRRPTKICSRLTPLKEAQNFGTSVFFKHLMIFHGFKIGDWRSAPVLEKTEIYFLGLSEWYPTPKIFSENISDTLGLLEQANVSRKIVANHDFHGEAMDSIDFDGFWSKVDPKSASALILDRSKKLRFL